MSDQKITGEMLTELYERTGLQGMYLGGVCADGFEGGKGRLTHLASGPGPALCGQKEGRRSAGWTNSNTEIDCPRCLKKLPAELQKTGCIAEEVST